MVAVTCVTTNRDLFKGDRSQVLHSKPGMAGGPEGRHEGLQHPSSGYAEIDHLQFIYMLLVGTFPFNSFLAGFLCCCGFFVLTGSFIHGNDAESDVGSGKRRRAGV